MTPEQRKWLEAWTERVAVSGKRFTQMIDFEKWFNAQMELAKKPIKEYNLAEDLERNDERLGE